MTPYFGVVLFFSSACRCRVSVLVPPSLIFVNISRTYFDLKVAHLAKAGMLSVPDNWGYIRHQVHGEFHYAYSPLTVLVGSSVPRPLTDL